MAVKRPTNPRSASSRASGGSRGAKKGATAGTAASRAGKKAGSGAGKKAGADTGPKAGAGRPGKKAGSGRTDKKSAARLKKKADKQKQRRQHAFNKEVLAQHSEQVHRLAAKQVAVGKNKKDTMSVGLIVAMIALLVVFVAPPTFTYISTYQQARQLRQEVAAAKERQEELQDEVARWNDPQFIERQARQRLGYVKAGQTRYRVVDPDPAYLKAHQKKQDTTPTRPWYVQMQESIAQAGIADEDKGSVTTKKGKPAEGAVPQDSPTK